MTSPAEARALVAVAELEEKLAAEKADGGGVASLDTKAELRDARRAYRELREARNAGPGAARPATIESTTGVHGK